MLQEVWLHSGNRLPKMQATMTEAVTLIPFIQRVSDTLASDHTGELKLFAARDAECLYDDYAIVHAEDKKKALLPASTDLWESKGWRKKDVAQSFLSRYGLTREVVMNTDQLVSVIDSGFYGTVGKQLDRRVKSTYGRSLSKKHRLKSHLVNAGEGAFGSEIMEITSQDLPQHGKMLPRASKGTSGIFRDFAEPTYLVARGLELMPRYHGPYTGIAQRRGQAFATMSKEATTQDVDNPKWSSDSIVNRLAAALVQYRVVRAALERTPYGDALPRSSGEPRPVSRGLKHYLQTHFGGLFS